MGRQIQLAQAPQDEADLCAFLGADWLALPREYETFAPVPLQALPAGNVVLFLKRFEAIVASQDLGPRVRTARLCIEWNRTGRTGTVPVRAHVAGRLYLSLSDPDPIVTDTVGRDMIKEIDRLMRWVRRTYPRATAERVPTWIGPALSEQLDAGQAMLVWPNGQPRAV